MPESSGILVYNGFTDFGGCVYNNAGINGGSFVRSVMRWKE